MAGENHPGGILKIYWLPLAFGAGVALGIFIEHPGADAPVPSTAPEVAHALPENSPAVHVPPAVAPPAAAKTQAAIAAPARPVAAMTQGAAAEPLSGGQPIDPGPVFARQFAEAQRTGFRSLMAEQHAALEGESRDDSWAYPMEGEIQNSMVADVSMGNFKMEHLECRASMCELRLSAQGEQQQAALRKWNEGLHTTPVSPQLLMTSGSFISEDKSTDALIIFKKPQAAAPKH